ncbi:MAG: hypothetical protein ACREEB_15710 [Caulobacteraceae bacterium]
MTRVIVFIAILALAGCAKVGTLDRPAPLFGERAKANYRAEKAREAAAKAEKPDNGQPEPLPASTPAEANPPVTGPSNKVNGQPQEPPPSPELPPAAPQ